MSNVSRESVHPPFPSLRSKLLLMEPAGNVANPYSTVAMPSIAVPEQGECPYLLEGFGPILRSKRSFCCRLRSAIVSASLFVRPPGCVPNMRKFGLGFSPCAGPSSSTSPLNSGLMDHMCIWWSQVTSPRILRMFQQSKLMARIESLHICW